MSDMDRIKETIRDLLNLADNDGAFEQEAENALRFARKLMNRHGLDQSDLEEERDATSVAAAADVEYGRRNSFSESSTLSKWEETVATTACEILGTVQWYVQTKILKKTPHGTVQTHPRTGKPLRGTRMVFYGPAGDCEHVIDLLDEWRALIMAMARLKYGGVFKGPGRSYCEGFAHSLWRKFAQIREEEERQKKQLDGDRSMALMLVNSSAIQVAKKEKGSDWLKNVEGIKLQKRPATSYRKHHGDAFNKGVADGKRANVSAERKKRLG